MTPEQEGARQDTLYLKMMESWPQFNQKNIQQFIDAHHVTAPDDIAYVKRLLTDANKYSF